MQCEPVTPRAQPDKDRADASLPRYNHLFVNPINANSAAFNGPPLSRFNGSSIVLGFKNGSEATFPLTAISLNDFTGVVDGKSFVGFHSGISRSRLPGEDSC